MNKFVCAVAVLALLAAAEASVLFRRVGEPEHWSLHARANSRSTLKFRVALKHKEGSVAELEVRCESCFWKQKLAPVAPP